MHLFTINEFFASKSDANAITDDILRNELNVQSYSIDIKKIDDDAFVSMVMISKLDEKEAGRIEHEINKSQPSFLNEKNIWIDYSKDELFEGDFTIRIVIKKVKQKEVKPDGYVYHLSPKSNRENIEREGILPLSSKDSAKWKNSLQLSYPASIFVDQDKDNLFHSNKGYDVWKIDTAKIDNKFYLDVNDPYKGGLMTFKKILPHAVELV
jgi:hypothetical protein